MKTQGVLGNEVIRHSLAHRASTVVEVQKQAAVRWWGTPECNTKESDISSAVHPETWEVWRFISREVTDLGTKKPQCGSTVKDGVRKKWILGHEESVGVQAREHLE